MPFIPIRLKPGIVSDYTPTLNEMGWTDSQLIRWDKGLPQKLGGWTRYISSSFNSAVRALHAWLDIASEKLLAIATENNLWVATDRVPASITPTTRSATVAVDFSTTMGSSLIVIVASAAALGQFDSVLVEVPVTVGGLIIFGLYPVTSVLSANSFTITAAANAGSTVTNGGAVPVFTTTSGSSTVNVDLTGHGQFVGDTVEFLVPTTVGGVTILGPYVVLQVVDADNYTIVAATQASSSTTGSMNGGDETFVYYLTSGPAPAAVGWGAGTWGAGEWGLGVSSPVTPGTPVTADQWSLDNFGEILLAAPKGGALYQWRPRSGFGTASAIGTAPYKSNGMFVSMPAQICVLWGSCYDNLEQDALLVRWSAVGDYTDWIGTLVNQAGFYRLAEGSEIVGALQGPQQALLWTDIALWSMQYIGLPDVFGFNKIAEGCGMIARHASCILGGNVFWMSSGSFYTLSGGGVQELPCTVWDFVFQDLDTANQGKCIAAANSQFGEVAFYFPSLSGGTGEIDSYVKYNATEGLWDQGRLSRTAWIDQSVVGQAVGGTPNGVIYQHETSPDADGQPLVNYVLSGWAMLSEGDPLYFVDLIMPDFRYGYSGGAPTAQIDVTVKSQQWPNSTSVTMSGPFTFTNTSLWKNMRIRDRMINFQCGSSDIGSFWRLGSVRFRGQPDGHR